MKKHTTLRGIFPGLSYCGLLGLLAVVPACSSTSDIGTPEAGATATFTDVYTMILSPGCAIAGCHTGGTDASGSLDMSTPALAYTNLVDKAAEGPLCVSSGAIRVKPNQPSQSLLVSKVTQTTPTCGLKMPATGNALTPDQVALITEWITAGAMND